MRRLVFLTVVLVGCIACGGVNKDVAYWWRCDDASGATKDPPAFRDFVKYGAVAPRTVFLNAEGQAPELVREDVPVGVRGIVKKDVPCLHVTQPTNYVARAGGGQDLVTYSQGVQVLEKDEVPPGDATFFIRFKWEGRLVKFNGSYNYQLRLYDNAFYATGAYGWLINFASYGGVAGNAWARVEVGARGLTASSANVVPEESLVAEKITGDYMDFYADGHWYEFAVTLKSVAEENRTYVNFYRTVGDIAKVYCASGFVGQVIKARDVNNRKATLFRGATDSTFAVTNPTATTYINNFRGKVDEIKIWNRALSRDEVFMLLGGDGRLWSAGLQNDSSDEFSDAAPAEKFDSDAMTWNRLRKTLTAENPSMTFVFDIPTNSIAQRRILRVKPLAPLPSGAALNVSLNGSAIGEMPLSENAWLSISAATWERLVDSETGRSELKLERTSGCQGDLQFDCIELGGGWQLGACDGDCTEFTWNGKFNVWAANRNDKEMRANLNRNQKTYVRFPLSAEMAEKCSFVLDTKLLHTYYNLPLTIKMNNKVVYQTDRPLSPNVVCKFGPGELNTENTITFETGDSTSASDVVAFDYLRLTPRLPGGGLCLIVR